MDFSKALTALKSGEQIRREGWNGAGQFVALMPGYPNGVPANEETARAIGVAVGATVRIRAYMILHTSQGDNAMWVPSVSDCLAEDWEVV
jgi:hypothetical protein